MRPFKKPLRCKFTFNYAYTITHVSIFNPEQFVTFFMFAILTVLYMQQGASQIRNTNEKRCIVEFPRMGNSNVEKIKRSALHSFRAFTQSICKQIKVR